MHIYAEHEDFDIIVQRLSSSFTNVSAVDLLPTIVDVTDNIASGIRLLLANDYSDAKINSIKDDTADMLFDLLMTQVPSGIRPTEKQVNCFYDICTELVLWLIDIISAEINWMKYSYVYRMTLSSPASDAKVGLTLNAFPLGDSAPDINDLLVNKDIVKDFISSIIKL